MNVRSHIPSPSVARGIAAVCAAVLIISAASTARAAGVVGTGSAQSCTDAALDTALADGGLVTFDCGPDPVTIDISTGTGTKIIAAGTTFDGGGLITISGGNSVGVFSVNSGVNFTVENLTIANGKTTGVGGGILNNGSLTVTNSTVSNSAAQRFLTGSGGAGGGIWNDGTLTVTNTIVANSPAGGNCSSSATDGGDNIDDGTTCGFSGTSLSNTNPMLDPTGLASNGGPTQTIALLAGSPAINAGDSEACASLPVNGVDQRYYARPGEGSVNCSIGAYEYNSSGPPPVTATATPTATATATPTPTNTLVPSATPSASPTPSPTPTTTATRTVTRTPTASATPSPSATLTATAPPSGGGGCAITPTGTGSAGWWLLAVALLFARRRRGRAHELDALAQALLKAESLNEKEIREVTGLTEPHGQEDNTSTRLQAGTR